MLKWLCALQLHKLAKTVRSGWLVKAKGEGRDVAVFDGELHICECGEEVFQGRPRPWFEGSSEQFRELLNSRGEVLPALQ